MDAATARRAGELMATARASGGSVAIEDAWIAATADTRGMMVLTRNLRHFRPMGVAAADPFRELPPEVESAASL